jgi:hypothetical protein
VGEPCLECQSPSRKLPQKKNLGQRKSFLVGLYGCDYFPCSGEKFPGLVPTRIRPQTIDKTKEISGRTGGVGR